MLLGKPKERQRFYLLPGQGGEAYRRKQRFILMWVSIAALLVSGALGAILFWLDRAQF
jgi:hypothetical protein